MLTPSCSREELDDFPEVLFINCNIDISRHGQLEDEEVSEEKRAEPLTLISYATMRSIVDFLETGSLKMGDQNVKHLLQAADMLAIGSLETEIFNFLKSGMTVGNCVKRFLLADAKPSWHKLSTHVQRFIQLRFDQLMKQTQVNWRIFFAGSIMRRSAGISCFPPPKRHILRPSPPPFSKLAITRKGGGRKKRNY